MEKKKSKWIEPFTLSRYLDDFRSLYKIISKEEKEKQKKSPIMICGPTGVGKSMFVDEFKKMAEPDYEIRKKEDKEKNNGKSTLKDKLEIISLNCASFSSGLLTSEIFGHVKGSFTGAGKDKKGLVEKAEGGVLILEEIGELPEDGQAKLLTFIEDGYFYKVGGITPKKANVQIIATTNKEKEDLREDFWYRFFPFFVPPLHQRREDVFYYLKYSFPDILNKLRPWEALTLLAYNWPGNVREIERVGRMIEWGEENIKRLFLPLSTESLDHLTGFNETYTALDAKKSKRLKSKLEEMKIKTDLLETVLNKYGLGLLPKEGKKNKPTWKHFTKTEDVLFDEIIVEKISKGLEFFCSLFLLDIKSDMNLFDFIEGDFIMPEKPPLSFIDNPTPEHHKLTKRIIEYRIGAKLSKDLKEMPVNLGDDYDHLKKMISERAEDARRSRKIETDPASMTEEETIAQYYSALYRDTGGNIKEMAKIAGRGETTIRDKIKKYDLKKSTDFRDIQRKSVLNVDLLGAS
jgi:DNA-binding NtrC family response regulator